MGNLGLSQVATNQNNKETTINDADAQLEQALTELSSVSLTALVSPLVATTAQWLRSMRVDFNGALTADFTISLPAVKKFAIVSNSTTGGFNVILQIVGGASIKIRPGGQKTIYADGVNVNFIADTGVKLGAFQSGLVVNSGFFLRFLAPFNFTIKAGLPNTQVSFSVAPTAAKTFTLHKNGVAFGTIALAAGTGAVTLTAAADTSFVEGTDVLDIATPAQDVTLADLSIIVPAIRTS